MSIYEICSVPSYKINYEASKKFCKPIETIINILNTDFQFHERLHKNDMLKLSVDVDKMTEHNPNITLDKIFYDIASFIGCEVNNICYTKNDAITTGSHHIVIPTYCMLSSKQKKFWAEFKNKYGYGAEIDHNIFDRDGWFRLPNQTKENNAGTEHKIVVGNIADFVLKYVEGTVEYNWEPPVSQQKIDFKPIKPSSPVSVASIQDLDMNDKYIDLLFNVIENNLDWNDWFKIAGALKYNNYPFEVFDTFSKKSTKYIYAETRKLWDDIKNPSKHISIHTLQNIAKNNKNTLVAYKDWLYNHEQFDMTTQLFTTGLIADYFAELYNNMYIMSDERLYYWNGFYWKRDDKRYSNLTNFVDDVFTKDLRDYANKKLTQSQDEDKRKKIAEFIINVAGIRKNGFRKGLIDDILYKITRNDIEFNTKPLLFAFNNAVFDLQKGETITPNPEDYITMSCGYDYKPINASELKELEQIIDSIFPNKNIKSHYLEILATGLTGIQLEKCCVATGVGGNGKSMINSLMLLTCGEYGYKLPSSILLREIKEGANPELANMDCVRFTLAQEPDRNKKINSSTLKELSGDDTLNVRGLYSSKCKIKLLLTMLLEANDLPKLDEVNPALSRRMDITPFTTRAVSKEDYELAEDKTGLVISNPYYKTDEFKHKYKCVLFHLLQPYVKIFINNGYTLSSPPEEIKKANNKYLASSDNLFDWFISEYELCEGEIVSIKDIYEVWNVYINQTSTMTRRAKEKLGSKKKLEEEIEKNLFMSKYLKGRNQHYNKIKLTSPTMCGWRRKPVEVEEPVVQPREDDTDEELIEE